MKTLFRRAPFLSVVVAAAFTFNVAPPLRAQTSTSKATTSKTATPKTATSVNVRTFDRALDADLLAAVKESDAAKVRALLARKAEPSLKDTGGNKEPVLVIATLNGNVEIVRALVEAGANVDATTIHDSTPLSVAALKGRVEISKYLLQRGAKVEGADPDGITPLMLAARSGETDIVRALIAAKADVNARTVVTLGSQTPLHYACEDSSFGIVKLEIVKMLVEAGADVSLKNAAGKTAIEVAILGKGKTRSNAIFYALADIEKYLIPIYGRDRALFMAIGKLYSDNGNLNSSTRAADWQAVKDALAKGATARFTDNDSGATTLIFASFGLRDADDATMQTLVARSNLNEREKLFGYTALHVAVTNNNLKMVGWLIQAGADLNLLDSKQKTPLDLAAKNAEILALLKKAGAKTSTEVKAEVKAEEARLAAVKAKAQAEEVRLIELKNLQEKRDIMLYDALAKQKPVWSDVQKALDAGATARYVGFNGTALMYLAFATSASDDIIKEIVARADVNAAKSDGETALHNAAWLGNTRLITALLKAGAEVNLVRKDGTELA